MGELSVQLYQVRLLVVLLHPLVFGWAARYQLFSIPTWAISAFTDGTHVLHLLRQILNAGSHMADHGRAGQHATPACELPQQVDFLASFLSFSSFDIHGSDLNFPILQPASPPHRPPPQRKDTARGAAAGIREEIDPISFSFLSLFLFRL